MKHFVYAILLGGALIASAQTNTPVVGAPPLAVGLPPEGLPIPEDPEAAFLVQERLRLEEEERQFEHERRWMREEEARMEAETRAHEERGLLVLQPGPDGKVTVGYAPEQNVLADVPFTRAIPQSIVAGPPVGSTTNLTGLYVVGRGSQVFSWTQPLAGGVTDPQYGGYRLYWWVSGSTVTNTVDLPKAAQKLLMSGLAGGSSPLTFMFMTVVATNGLESAQSNMLLIPSEP